jgi:deoxyribonuclease-1
MTVSKKLLSLVSVLITAFIVTSSVQAGSKGNTRIQSFKKAKKIALKQVYRGHQTTFYCESQYTLGRHVIHTNGYAPKTRSKRAHRLEWELIVPAYTFGQSFVEWREGHPECVDRRGKPVKGQKCARKQSRKFRYMESDLYNLVPAIGEINGLRSNYSFAMIPGEEREFGTCDMEIKNRMAEPRSEIRGDIARIYFYMNWAYPGNDILSKTNQRLFEAWDIEDPIDDWECERTKRIEGIQRNQNPFVKKACVEAGIW